MPNEYDARQSAKTTGTTDTMYGGGDQGTATESRDNATNVAAQVKDKAEATADKAMDTGADQMQSTADTIREKVEGQGGIPEKAGTAVADGMERTATYLREHDSKEVMEDVENYIREHPMQAVVGAVAFGLIVGRVLR